MLRARLIMSCVALSGLSCGLGGSGLQAGKTGDAGGSSSGGGGGADAPADSGDDAGPSSPDDATPQGDGAGPVQDGAVDDVTKGTPDGAAGKTDAATADGGPNPGSVACAGTDCSLNGSICCTCPLCFPPFPTSCFPSFPGCVTGRPLHCDDRTDCTSGQVCCAAYTSGTFTGSSCKSSCASGDVQLCRVDAECAKGSCAASSSIPGFTACM